MDQCTENARMQNWKTIISQCQSRPEEQSAKQWLVEHNIREATYYFGQRKIRQAAYGEMQSSQDLLPVPAGKSELSFAEISLPGKSVPIPAKAVKNPDVIAVIKTSHVSIEISSDIPGEILNAILREVSHA